MRARRSLIGKRKFCLAAKVLGALGEMDRAFELIDRAVEERDDMLITARAEPAYDPLRSDPRFDRLLERLNLAE